VHAAPDLKFPQLLGTVTATVGQRFARRIAVLGLTVVVSSIAALTLPRLPLPLPTVAGGKIVPAVLVAVLAMTLVDLVAVFASGRLPTDLVLGLRCVGVDGRKQGGWSMMHELLVSISVLATAGILPAVLALTTSDPFRRSWIDRLLGLVILDVRAGRDVVARPVRPSEIEDHARPARTHGLPIVAVGEAPVHEGLHGSAVTFTSVAKPSAPRYRMLFDDGVESSITRRTLVGRAPAQNPQDPEVDLISVPDPTMSLSKTHVLLAIDEGGVWVRDLGSTNGTAVVRPGAAPMEVDPSKPELAPPGSVVRFGERWFAIQAGDV
jgi:FHA domain